MKDNMIENESAVAVLQQIRDFLVSTFSGNGGATAATVHLYKIEAPITNFYAGTLPQDVLPPAVDGIGAAPAVADADEALAERIRGCFFGDGERARQFVEQVRHMNNVQITQLVAKYVAEEVISKLSCRKDLWEPLHEAHIYTASLRNWNYYID